MNDLLVSAPPDTAPPLFSDTLAQALSKTAVTSSREVEQILQHKSERWTAGPDFSEIWDLKAHRLSQVEQVNSAAPETQKALLADLAQGRFREAFGIEKAGMSFAAKMSLLAPNLNEQKLYSLFAAEEARHFDFIQTVLGDAPDLSGDPFIGFLNELIISAERRPLLLIIQVVLEGWGLDHYAGMLKTCQVEALKGPLQQILSDEAGHHGSGLSLFQEADMTPAEFHYTLEMMSAFLDMVRIGPVSLMHTLDSHLGGLSEPQKQRILTEMDAHADTTRKLNLLKGLMQKAQAGRILAALETKSAFKLLF